VPLQGLDAPAIALDQVPLPRPRPVAQIERALPGHHNIAQ